MEAAKSSSALAACRTTMYHLSSSSSSEDELSFGANQENSVAAGPNIAVDIDNSAGVLDDSVAGVDDSSGTLTNVRLQSCVDGVTDEQTQDGGTYRDPPNGPADKDMTSQIPTGSRSHRNVDDISRSPEREQESEHT